MITQFPNLLEKDIKARFAISLVWQLEQGTLSRKALSMRARELGKQCYVETGSKEAGFSYGFGDKADRGLLSAAALVALSGRSLVLVEPLQVAEGESGGSTPSEQYWVVATLAGKVLPGTDIICSHEEAVELVQQVLEEYESSAGEKGFELLSPGLHEEFDEFGPNGFAEIFESVDKAAFKRATLKSVGKEGVKLNAQTITRIAIVVGLGVLGYLLLVPPEEEAPPAPVYVPPPKEEKPKYTQSDYERDIRKAFSELNTLAPWGRLQAVMSQVESKFPRYVYPWVRTRLYLNASGAVRAEYKRAGKGKPSHLMRALSGDDVSVDLSDDGMKVTVSAQLDLGRDGGKLPDSWDQIPGKLETEMAIHDMGNQFARSVKIVPAKETGQGGAAPQGPGSTNSSGDGYLLPILTKAPKHGRGGLTRPIDELHVAMLFRNGWQMAAMSTSHQAERMPWIPLEVMIETSPIEYAKGVKSLGIKDEDKERKRIKRNAPSTLSETIEQLDEEDGIEQDSSNRILVKFVTMVRGVSYYRIKNPGAAHAGNKRGPNNDGGKS